MVSLLRMMPLLGASSPAVSEECASKPNPQISSRSKLFPPRSAARAASLTQVALTVPYCGPTLTATRCGVPLPPPRRTPSNWMYGSPKGVNDSNNSRSALRPFYTPTASRFSCTLRRYASSACSPTSSPAGTSV